MSTQDMINDFLKNNEVTKCETEGLEYSSDTMNKTKSHRTAYDYMLEPMWDGLEVYDNELDEHVAFTARTSRTGIKAGAKKNKVGATITYSMSNHGGAKIRQDTISDRIKSGRYKITKKPKE